MFITIQCGAYVVNLTHVTAIAVDSHELILTTVTGQYTVDDPEEMAAIKRVVGYVDRRK